jgi:hypothetical protein
MQDWDRLVMIIVGAAVAIYTGIDGWKLWKRKNWLAVCGIGLLMLSAVGLPIMLAMFAT